MRFKVIYHSSYDSQLQVLSEQVRFKVGVEEGEENSGEEFYLNKWDLKSYSLWNRNAPERFYLNKWDLKNFSTRTSLAFREVLSEQVRFKDEIKDFDGGYAFGFIWTSEI